MVIEASCRVLRHMAGCISRVTYVGMRHMLEMKVLCVGSCVIMGNDPEGMNVGFTIHTIHPKTYIYGAHSYFMDTQATGNMCTTYFRGRGEVWR